MLKLTKEQEDKLKKLEKEMNDKRVREESTRTSNIQSSQMTGIPINIISMDVIKIGLMIGLLKTKADFDSGKKSTGGLLSSLLNFGGGGSDDDSDTNDMEKYRDVPPHYMLIEPSSSQYRLSEKEKLTYHVRLTNRICTDFQNDVSALINDRIEQLRPYVTISIGPKSCTISQFVNECVESVKTLCEFFGSTPSGGGDGGDGDEWLDDEETDSGLNDQLNALFKSLLWFLDVRTYRCFVTATYQSVLRKTSSSSSSSSSLTLPKLIRDLCCIDSVVNSLPNNSVNNTDDDDDNMYVAAAVETQLTIAQHIRDPKLIPFDASAIVRGCCSPAMMLVDVRHIISTELIGPFNNNSIGYLVNDDDEKCGGNDAGDAGGGAGGGGDRRRQDEEEDASFSSSSYFMFRTFYILSEIKRDTNVRLWVLDDGAMTTTTCIVYALRQYAIELFKSIYFRSYQTHDYIPSFWIDGDYRLRRLMDNISILSDIRLVNIFIRQLVKTRSVILPTEFDVFNHLPSKRSFEQTTGAIEHSSHHQHQHQHQHHRERVDGCLLFETKVCEKFRKIWPTMI